MELLKKSDKELKEIAQPIWDNLVKSSNIKDYGTFTKDFSSQMLYGANEVELGKQWANNKLLTSLSEKQEFLGTIRRNQFITVLYKQTSQTMPGEFLGRLVLGVEDGNVKVFGATIY
jgi:L-rhamnose mutarotase